MEVLLAGFLLGISLIVALGPQNILLIKQGIRRESITAVILVCFFSDAILIPLGTLDSGLVVTQFPMVLDVLKFIGVAFLGWFAFSAFKDAFFPTKVDISTEERAERQERTKRPGMSSRPVVAAIALTWLNPSAYIDTFVLLGGIANQYGPTDRWLLTIGALLASAVWFPLVGYGAGFLAGPLSRPNVWRVINAIFGIILTVLTVKIALL